MATAQRISGAFPFAVYVNETNNKQSIAPGVYINQTISTATAGRRLLTVMRTRRP